MVSLAVFWVGGVLSLLEGINHLFDEDKLIDPRWAFAVLGVSAVLEGLSLRTTVRAWRFPAPRVGLSSWRQLLRDTKAPESYPWCSSKTSAR